MVLLCIAWNIQQIHATKRKTKFSFQWTFKRFLERHYFKLKTFNKVIEVLELPVGAEPSQPAPVPRKVLIAQHNHLNQKGKDIATAITVWIINITLYFMHNVAYCK